MPRFQTHDRRSLFASGWVDTKWYSVAVRSATDWVNPGYSQAGQDSTIGLNHSY